MATTADNTGQKIIIQVLRTSFGQERYLLNAGREGGKERCLLEQNKILCAAC